MQLFVQLRCILRGVVYLGGDEGWRNDLQVRLVGGPVPHEGRLEIYHDGKWGTVCSDDFSEKAASLACRHLYPGFVALL